MGRGIKILKARWHKKKGGGYIYKARESERRRRRRRRRRRKESELDSQARKGNLLKGKQESDWPLRRTSVLSS